MTIISKTGLVAAALAFTAASACASSVFQGRLADGTASATCTVTGTTKCAMFYDSNLNITILNDWNIGRGFWSATAAAGSAQALAESAGAAQTDFTGWFLPTGDGNQAAGARNQYLSIWNDVGGSLAGLQAQFDGVQSNTYFSGTELASNPIFVFAFFTGSGIQALGSKSSSLYAVAVRPGDVAASVPEPQTLALALLALGATVVVRRKPR